MQLIILYHRGCIWNKPYITQPTNTLSNGATIDPTAELQEILLLRNLYCYSRGRTTTQEWTVTVTVESAPAATSDVVKVGDSIILYNGVPVKI
jgi:hypothetical protein